MWSWSVVSSLQSHLLTTSLPYLTLPYFTLLYFITYMWFRRGFCSSRKLVQASTVVEYSAFLCGVRYPLVQAFHSSLHLSQSICAYINEVYIHIYIRVGNSNQRDSSSTLCTHLISLIQIGIHDTASITETTLTVLTYQEALKQESGRVGGEGGVG